MTIARHFLGLLGYRVLLAVIILITDVVVARAFGPEWKGYLAILFVTPLVISTVTSLGFDFGLNYLGHKDPHRLFSYFATALILGTATSVIVAIALGFDAFGSREVVFSSIPATARNAIAPALFAIPAETFFVLSAYLAITSGQFAAYGRMRVLRRSLVLISVVLSAWLWATSFPFNLAFVVTSQVLAIILAGSYAIWACNIPVLAPTSDVRLVLRSGMSAYLGRLAERLLLRLDVLLLGILNSAHDVGLYSVAVGIAEGVFLVSTTLETVLFAVRAEGGEQSHFAAFRAMVAAGAIFVLTCAGASCWLIPLIYGGAFRPSIILLLLLLPGVYLLFSHMSSSHTSSKRANLPRSPGRNCSPSL